MTHLIVFFSNIFHHGKKLNVVCGWIFRKPKIKAQKMSGSAKSCHSSFGFNVLSKTYIAIEATEIIPIPESVATLSGIKNQTQ